MGGWLNYDFDWHNHHLIVWGHGQPRPADWWSRRPSERPRVELARATVWQPRNRPAVAAQGFDRGYDSRPVRSTVTVIRRANIRAGRSAPLATGQWRADWDPEFA